MTPPPETKSAPSENPPDRVGDALKKLTLDVTKSKEAVKGLAGHEELMQFADRIQVELESKRLNMTKQQLEELTREANFRALDLRIATVEAQVFQGQLDALTQRYRALEQVAAAKNSRVPEWARPMVEQAKSAANAVFENSKGLFSMIGGFFGKSWESSKDVLKSMKGFFFGALKGDIGKSIPFFGPQIAQWAEREYFQESILTGIRQAVKDKKIPGLTVTLNESSWNKTDSNALIKKLKLHDPKNPNMEAVANDYARLFIEEQAKTMKVPSEKPHKLEITASALEQATFVKPFAVAATPAAVSVAPAASAAPAAAPAPANTQPAAPQGTASNIPQQ